jgi:hypothetical protein
MTAQEKSGAAKGSLYDGAASVVLPPLFRWTEDFKGNSEQIRIGATSSPTLSPVFNPP